MIRIGKLTDKTIIPRTRFGMLTYAATATATAVTTASPAAVLGVAGTLWLVKLWLDRDDNDGYIGESLLTAAANTKTSAASSDVTEALANYGLKNTRLIDIVEGPVLNRHLIALPAGTKLGKLPTADIARDLGVESITIDANAGRNMIGVDIPRQDRQEVKLTTVLTSSAWATRDREWRLPACPGVDQFGNPVVFNLSKTPHLLIGGTTDSGKSVFANAILLSLIHSGADFRLLIADGKGVDFAKPYAKSKHLLKHAEVSPIETEVDGIRHQVLWLATEMDRRYREEDYPHDIVFVCDELADITLQDDKEKTVTKTLARLAQKARGARIHLILITQYPKADVLHPLVAANTPSRAGMMVGKDHESRVIIDDNGCEDLLGFGDCILVLAGQKPRRIHGANVTEAEMQQYLQ